MNTIEVSAQETFRNDVSAALTILLGASRALAERPGLADDPRARELTEVMVRKSEELHARLAPVLRKL